MNRPVTIAFALNGWTAQVGCQTLVFNNLDEALGQLRSYLQDPADAERAFLKEAINRKITMGIPFPDGPVGRSGPVGCVGTPGPVGPSGDPGYVTEAANAPAYPYPVDSAGRGVTQNG